MIYFANPWGLLGLLALPAIAFIHLYQRRYPPLQVAGLHLWATETQVKMPGRKRDRLPITRTLILELLAALFLSLVLADPRVAAWDEVTHLVVILDHSASMRGRSSDGRTFREHALDALESRLAKLGRRDVVTLIRSGSLPVTLCRRASLEETRKVMAAWEPGAPTHRIATAWEELGRQFVETNGRMLFLTDTLPDKQMVPANLEVVSVGRKVANASINAARWTVDPKTGQGTVYARLQSNSPTKLTGELLGKNAGGQTLMKQPFALEPYSAQALNFPIPGGLGRIDLELSCQDDSLDIDNRLTLIEPKLRSVGVSISLPNGAAKRQFERVLKILPETRTTTPEEAQLQIAPAETSPPAQARTWFLAVGPWKSNAEARAAAKDLTGPYLLEKRHPLLEGITLDGVIWGGVQPISGNYVPLASTGTQSLIVQLQDVTTTAYGLNLDFTRTNLPESPDWPVLMNNLLELRRDALPGLRRWNFRIGEIVRFRLYEGRDPQPDTPVVLTSGELRRELPRESLMEIGGLDQLGVYELKSGTEDLGRFAVNFLDATESNLQSLVPGEIAPEMSTRDSGILMDNTFTWLLWLLTAIILGLVIGDWYVLRPQPVR